MANFISKLGKDRKGQDVMEYALIGGLMASLVIAVVPSMMSITLHLIEILQGVAQVAIRAAAVE